MLGKAVVAAAALLMGTVTLAQAQWPYPPYPVYPYSPSTAAPPSWSFDPYTSGLAACPQRFPGDPPCSFTLQPSFGQPDYRSMR